MSEAAKPVPAITGETRPFWEGCAAGELRLQTCQACGRPQFYPRAVCAGCGGTALAWRPSAERGTVHALTVVERAPSPAFRGDVPYVVALVDLDEGVRMMANIVGCPPERVAIGDRVRVVFERRGDVTLPQFTPEDATVSPFTLEEEARP
jgi:hypothetical protein